METKAKKAATFLTSIINRYPPEADLQFDPMEGYSAEEERYEWDTSVSYEEALEHLVGVSSTSSGTDKVAFGNGPRVQPSPRDREEGARRRQKYSLSSTVDVKGAVRCPFCDAGYCINKMRAPEGFPFALLSLAGCIPL